MANSQKPLEEVRLGLVKAAIWQNQTETGVRHSASFSRIYKDGDDWKTTTSFYPQDLLLLAKVADHAHTRILELQKQQSQAQTD